MQNAYGPLALRRTAASTMHPANPPTFYCRRATSKYLLARVLYFVLYRSADLV